MNSFNNSENVSVNSEIESHSLLVDYDNWEVGYTPSEVWVVAPESTKWSIDSSTPNLLSELEGAILREDGKLEVRFEGNYLNNKTVVLYCMSSSEFNAWTYLDINFPINDVDGNQLQTHSIGWNIRTITND